MDNETTPVDSAVASSSPATTSTLARPEQQNAASVTRVPPFIPGESSYATVLLLCRNRYVDFVDHRCILKVEG